MHELSAQLLSYLKATWRYRWYAVAFAWIVAIGGWIAVYLTPDRYEASARVYVDTQSVLRPLLAGVTVAPNVDQLVGMMSRTLISRPNLEKVIRMADMDIKLKTPEDREKKIDQLVKSLTIGSAGRDNLYTIAYRDQSPQEAKRVVQSLLTIFVEGSLGDKRKDSDSARRFIDEQLKVYADKLVSAENSVTEFKRKNVGLMGGEGQSYYRRLVEAKAAVSQASLELKEAENARDSIKRQVTGENEAPPDLLGDRGSALPSEVSNPEIDARISPLQQKVDALRLSYTEQHPDIIAALRIMAQLKEQKQKDAEQKQREAKGRKPAPAPIQTQNPYIQQMHVSLANTEATVASMKARVAEYGRRYDELKGALDAVPQVEADFTQLTRDYEVTKTNYQNLLSRREQAQISGDMESNASVMDFRVIDPPQVPSAPSAPNRPLLMSVVLLAAIAGGLGIAFLISQLRPTFNDERRLQEVSGLPVFGTVILVSNEAQISKRKKGVLALIVSYVSLLSAYAAIMAALMLTTSGALR